MHRPSLLCIITARNYRLCLGDLGLGRGSLSGGGFCLGRPPFPAYGKERVVRILLEYILVRNKFNYTVLIIVKGYFMWNVDVFYTLLVTLPVSWLVLRETILS